jgi:hypothetical protein
MQSGFSQDLLRTYSGRNLDAIWGIREALRVPAGVRGEPPAFTFTFTFKYSHSHSQRTCRRARRAAGLAPGSARMAAGSTARKTGSPCIDEAGARVDEPERPVDEPDEADEADVTVAHRCSAASASALFPTPRAPVMRTPSTLPDAAPAATARSAPRMLSSVRRSSGRRPPRRGGGEGR